MESLIFRSSCDVDDVRVSLPPKIRSRRQGEVKVRSMQNFGNSGFLNYARSLNLGTRRSRKFFSFKGSSSSSPHPTSVSASSSLYSIPRQLIAEVCLLSVIMHGLHGLHTLSFTHVALWSSHKFIDTGLFSPGK